MDHKKVLEELISAVIHEGGSDLHITSGRVPVIRVAGELVSLVKYSVPGNDDVNKMLSQFIDEERWKKFIKNQEIDFSYTTHQGARFRGNAYVQKGKIGIALRLIPGKIPTLEELHLPNVLERFARLKQGFFLVTGPIGHGKTTTVSSLIDLINHERREHIITIEDPIEYLFKEDKSMIDQREIGIDTLDFHTALKAMFRQDIDVLMVGEMRDLETIATAVTAAETGHLVFSTLHTNTASQTIDRIIDSFPSDQQGQIRAQLSQSLAGIFSQRLVPRISGGLIPAYELLINNNAVANLIREGRTFEINVVVETGSGDGMIDMNRVLADLVRKGEITPDSAFVYSQNVDMLQRMI